MKILVLVLSFNEPPFSDFMKAQQETWDSISHPEVDTLYYHGGKLEDKQSIKELMLNCSDAYEMMHWKFKLALDALSNLPWQYDLIFRTNACSYVDKERLVQAAMNLPREQCYAGYCNGKYISGAGIFMSMDVCEILRNELTEAPHGAEDVLIGDILCGRIGMIDDHSRIDAGVDGVKAYNSNSYHFRFKTSNDPKDRYRDIDNMRKLHQQFI